MDKLVIVHGMKKSSSEFESPITLPPTGHKIEICTAFGKASFIIRDFRLSNPKAMGVISKNEPVSMVIRKCLQRSITLMSIFKKDKTFDMIASLIEHLTVEQKDDTLQEMWRNLRNRSNMATALTNDKKFEESMEICNSIEKKLSIAGRSQNRLSFVKHLAYEKARLAKAGRSALLIYSAAFSSYVFQLLSVIFDPEKILKVEQGYINCLDALISSAIDQQKYNVSMDKVLQDKEVYKMDNNTFELEKMAIVSYRNVQQNTEITGKVKEEIRTIDAISIVHQLRNTLVDTCFVGVVGLQNCGKSSLINRIWNVGAESGHTEKTTMPNVYRITDKFHVVDYPGSQSIDDHAATFAQSGIMNNLIIVILRYDGQVNKALLEEVQTALSIVKMSNGSGHVMFCINKADQDAERLTGELQEKGVVNEKPFEHMKKLHLTQLRDKLAKNAQREGGFDQEDDRRAAVDEILGKNFEENYFFTSFTMDDPKEAAKGVAELAREAGVIGVWEVKGKIRQFLRMRKLFKTEWELDACLEPPASVGLVDVDRQ